MVCTMEALLDHERTEPGLHHGPRAAGLATLFPKFPKREGQASEVRMAWVLWVAALVSLLDVCVQPNESCFGARRSS